jgi:hypothetical protein
MMIRLKPWIAAILSVVGLSLPLWLLHHSGDAGAGPVVFLFTGSAFAERAIITAGALDQFSLHKELFIFCGSLVMLCPPIVFVRWISGQGSRILRRPFAIVSIAVLIHPLSALTIFTWDVARYICHMGVTPMRLTALAVAVAGYAAIAVFAAWMCRLKIRRPNHTPDSIHQPADGL